MTTATPAPAAETTVAVKAAQFVSQVAAGLSILEKDFAKQAEVQVKTAALAKQTATKLAECQMIAVSEIPQWEKALTENPEQALKTAMDLADQCHQLRKQATAEKQQAAHTAAVAGAINPGVAVLEKAGQYNGHVPDNVPASARVLLNRGSGTKL